MEYTPQIPPTKRELEKQAVEAIKDKFTPEFINKYYRNDATIRAVFDALLSDRIGPYAMIELLIEDRATLIDQLRHFHMYHASPRFIKYPECEDSKICPTTISTSTY